MKYKPKTDKVLLLTYQRIGDTILYTPFIRELRRRNPGSYIAATASYANFDCMKYNPHIDDVFFIDVKNKKETLRSICQMRRKKFDSAFLLKQNFFTEMVAYASGARARIGREKRTTNPIITHRIHEEDGYRGDTTMTFFNPIGGNGAHGIKPEVHLDIESKEYAKRLIDGKDRCIGISTCSSKEEKKWSIGDQLMLAEYFANRGSHVFFIGGPCEENDLHIARNFFKMSENDKVQIVNQNLKNTIALIGELDLLVSNDSFPHHAAAAQDIPAVIIFNNGEHKTNWKAPRDDHIGLVDQKCPANINLADVISACEQLMQKPRLKLYKRAEIIENIRGR